MHDGTEHRDADGHDLPDVAAARAYAVSYFGAMLHSAPMTFRNGEEWRMAVTDEAGLTLFSLHFLGVDAPVMRGPRAGIAGSA